MKLKNVVSLLIGCVFFVGIANAQTLPVQNQNSGGDVEVSDSELESFANVASELQMLNQQAQQTMVKAIQDNGMKINRFREIAQAKQQQQAVEMTSKEEKAFAAIQQTMQQEQMKIQQKMQALFKKHSMKRTRYMQISKAISSNQELQNRFRQLQQKKQQ